ncbi:MAG: helix-hairpin-helix domain-containing protein [Desulfitobacterium sp.]|nr:helix-hairpin-helix domain-containing protein [Desulfitobacterium sp.]
MERKFQYVWWGILGILVALAFWKFILPNNSTLILEKGEESREIVVYVSGAVEKPGLVSLPVDARLNDALEEVRPLPEANIELINPAERLKDGQKIIVPYKPMPQPIAMAPEQGQGQVVQGQVAQGQVAQGQVVQGQVVQGQVVQGQGLLGQSGAGGGEIAVQPYPTSSNLININTADAKQLQELPGIGPVLAERIIQYRMENGYFSRPEDLKRVSGIGEKTFEKMASMVTVGP